MWKVCIFPVGEKFILELLDRVVQLRELLEQPARLGVHLVRDPGHPLVEGLQRVPQQVPALLQHLEHILVLADALNLPLGRQQAVHSLGNVHYLVAMAMKRHKWILAKNIWYRTFLKRYTPAKRTAAFPKNPAVDTAEVFAHMKDDPSKHFHLMFVFV